MAPTTRMERERSTTLAKNVLMLMLAMVTTKVMGVCAWSHNFGTANQNAVSTCALEINERPDRNSENRTADI